jgi:hypothetical protein
MGAGMEWWAYLSIILGVLTLLFLSGLPIAFSFTLFNFIAVYFWMGGSSPHRKSSPSARSATRSKRRSQRQ